MITTAATDLPRDTRSLQSRVEAAKATLNFQMTRLKLEEERLALFEEQVKRCTMLAPNDGFVIYANEPGEPQRIWEGASIRQRQRMFYLPDLDRMEVQAMIHETVVDRVDVGLPAHVRFEALPGRSAAGQVTSVSRLPLVNQNSAASDVKYYLAVVRLDRIPSGLRPGMSAEIEIITSSSPRPWCAPCRHHGREGQGILLRHQSPPGSNAGRSKSGSGTHASCKSSTDSRKGKRSSSTPTRLPRRHCRESDHGIAPG